MMNRKGFTLIELLIVVVIIGILAAIAIPKFAATKEKAYLASMKSDLRNLATAQEAYIADNTVYFSGVNVDQLLVFLNRLAYPAEIIRFVQENRGKLDHLLYDVGFDYVARGAGLEFVKSGYYGVF